MRDVEPPGDQALERRDGGRARARGAVRPDDRDAGRVGVEPLRLGADHRLRHAAVAALEHGAALVDEEVVANVVPAVRAHVIGVDAADDPGGVRARRGRGGIGVVDEHHLELGRVDRRGAADRLVGVPSRASHDPRPDGERREHAARLRRRDARARDEGDLEAADVTAPVETDAARRPGPHGSLLRERHPAGPRAARGFGAKVNAAAPPPADAHHLEGAARRNSLPERVGEVRRRRKPHRAACKRGRCHGEHAENHHHRTCCSTAHAHTSLSVATQKPARSAGKISLKPTDANAALDHAARPGRPGERALRRLRRRRRAPARARDQARQRDQPCVGELREGLDRPSQVRPRGRARDPARHAGRPLDIDGGHLQGRAGLSRSP